MIVQAPIAYLPVEIELPSSKSISNRLLIIQALAIKKGVIHNLSEAEDTQTLIQLLDERPPIWNVGHAGTAARFLTAFLAITEGSHVLTGSDQMKSRPISPLVDALRDLGADINYQEQEGFLPLAINGKKLTGGKVSISANVSSQFTSALMLIAPFLEKGLEIERIGDVVSQPYVDMTASLMKSCGANVSQNNQDILIEPRAYFFEEFSVEADWSAAAFWYEMMALGDFSEITLKGLAQDSLQGDSNLVHVFEKIGVKSSFHSSGVVLQKGNATQRDLQVDMTHLSDVIQAFVVSVSQMDMETTVSGTYNLQFKESNRGEALKKELEKVNRTLVVSKNHVMVHGKTDQVSEHTPQFETYEDHRMAMAFAPLALKYGTVKIENAEVVNKSYPNYWSDLEKAGFQILED